MKKVLLLNLYAFPKIGGVENSLTFLSQSIKKQGGHPEILCFNPEIPDSGDIGIKIYRLLIPAIRIPVLGVLFSLKKYSKKISDFLNKNIYDEIWCRSYLLSYVLIKMNFAGNIKFIYPTVAKMNAEGLYQLSGNDSIIDSLRKKVFKYLDYRLHFLLESKVFRSEKIENVFFSKTLRDLAVQEYGDYPARLLNPGIDSEVFFPVSSSEFKTDLVVAKPYLLFVGRLALTKNLDYLISLSKVLPDNLKIVIVGDGPYREEFQRRIKDNGADQVFTFLGAKKGKDLARLYTNALATILPSKFESFGQVIIESFACGTPVIGYSNEDCLNASQEIICEPELGKVFSSFEDKEEVILYIKSLLERDNHKDFRLQFVKKNYSWDNFVHKMIDL